MRSYNAPKDSTLGPSAGGASRTSYRSRRGRPTVAAGSLQTARPRVYTEDNHQTKGERPNERWENRLFYHLVPWQEMSRFEALVASEYLLPLPFPGLSPYPQYPNRAPRLLARRLCWLQNLLTLPSAAKLGAGAPKPPAWEADAASAPKPPPVLAASAPKPPTAEVAARAPKPPALVGAPPPPNAAPPENAGAPPGAAAKRGWPRADGCPKADGWPKADG